MAIIPTLSAPKESFGPTGRHQTIKQFHSVRNDFTGLATAALMAWKLTVTNAMNSAAAPANTNTHQLTLTLCAKSCNRLSITNHAIGDATITAIATSLIKSFESMAAI